MSNPTPPLEDEIAPDLRSQLVKRLIVAGGLVAILLAGLATFDFMVANDDEHELPVYTKPVPVVPKKMATQPVVTEEPPPSVAQEDAKPAENGSSEGSRAPSTDPQNAGASTGQPPPPEVAATPVAKPSPGAAVTPAPAAPPAARRPVVVPEGTVSPPVARGVTAVPSRSVAAPPAPVDSPVAPVPAASAPRLFSGFFLQAGVFSSAQRAEELHAKLSLNGVPSTIETRVQVGPFKNRQEAEAAQRKLRELGVDSILLAPKGRR